MPSFGQHTDTLARWREFPALERLDEERVALTFDDGPDPDGTPGVLDALPDVAAFDPTPEEEGTLRDRLLKAGEQRAAPTQG